MSLKRLSIILMVFVAMVCLFCGDLVAQPATSSPGPNLETPEEIGGASLRDMDGINMMSREFSTSPSGQRLPETEDSLWIPDMSLARPSEARTAWPSANSLPAKPQSVPAAAPQTTDSQGVAAIPAATATAPSAATVAPVELAAAPAFTPGFQVGATQEQVFIPPVPPVNSPESYPKAGQPGPVSEYVPPADPLSPDSAQVNTQNAGSSESWSGAGVASTGSFAGDVAQNVQKETDSDSWGSPFSKPRENHDVATVDTIVSAQDAARMNLAEYTIEDIRVSGLEMSINRFNQLIKTKIGQKFNQQTLEEDKRTLLQTKQFIDVTVSTTILPDRPNLLTVNFDLTPRRLMQYIKVIGNTKISKSDILDELGMKRGESRMDPYDVENGRLRIIELYKNKGYNEPFVDILRGDRPDDVGVVYLISEGVKQRVLHTEFVGNKLTSGARLKSLVQCKPGVLYVIGGDFSRDLLDEDVTKLLEYYRKLGCFDCRVDREFIEGKGYTGLGKDNAWVSVRYVIDEGPRYKVRNFYFNGNRVLDDSKLADKLKVKKGDWYNYSELEQDRIALKYAYQDLGYVLAEIEPKQIITEEPGTIDIRYEVTENNRYRVRDILVDYDGNEARTKSTVILNMVDIRPSELIDGPKIRESERMLQRSGYFNDKPQDGILPTIKIVPIVENAYTIGEGNVLTRVNTSPSPESPTDSSGTSVAQAMRTPSLADVVKPVRTEKEPAAAPVPDKTQPSGLPSVFPESTNPSPPQQAQSDSIIRGQSRQIPTGFRTTTTSSDTSYQTQAAATGNSYAVNGTYSDTSMYGNAATAGMTNWQPGMYASPGTTGTTAPGTANSAAAPTAVTTAPPVSTQPITTQPITTQQNATRQFTTQQVAGTANPQLAAADPYGGLGYAPGFNPAGMAGRDAVFPGTPEQQALHNELGGNGTLTSPNGLIYDADVVAQVKEGRTGMFQASIGVNSDYGLVGNVSLTERNFDIMRWPTSVTRWDGWNDAFRGGGQIFQIQASPGTEIQRYSVSWDVPYIFNTKNSFGITGQYADRSYTEWFESRLGTEVRLGRQWTSRFSTSLNASLYQIKIKDPVVNYVPDLTSALGDHMQYTTGLNASYDTRNHPFLPSQGYVITGTGEMVYGDYQFPRFAIDARHYTTLRKRWDGTGRWVLGLRAASGWSGDNAPIYERYYGGGTANLRGFEYREVTPRYGTTGVGIGGNFEFYSSAEMLVPISGGDEFQLAFFVDSGTVSRTIKNWEKYRIAPGFGLRLSIPMLGPAPLALDFAFPIAKSDNDVDQVFSFSVSGSR